MESNKQIALVTGSSGLIGSAVINRLASRFTVIGFDRVGPPYPPPAADCIELDLTVDESIKQAFDRVREKYGKRIDSVIHLAAYYSFSGEDSPMYEMVTVRGTERLLRHLSEFQVGQFIFSSTMLVHKPCRLGEKINEASPLEAKWPYPQSKVDTENIIRKRHGDIPIVLARIAGVYDDYCHSIPISHQIQRVYENDFTSRVFPGNPNHGQSMIHLNDLVYALEQLVLRRDRLPKELTLLLGESEAMSYSQLQEAFCQLLHGNGCKVHRIPKVLAKAGAAIQAAMPGGEQQFIKPWMIDMADDHYALDISEADKHLGWKPKHKLRDSIASMIKALKADPIQWYKAHNLPINESKMKEIVSTTASK